MMRETKKLKLCPFCGGNNVESEQAVIESGVKCKDCRVFIIVRNGTEQQAISAWNKRVN